MNKKHNVTICYSQAATPAPRLDTPLHVKGQTSSNTCSMKSNFVTSAYTLCQWWREQAAEICWQNQKVALHASNVAGPSASSHVCPSPCTLKVGEVTTCFQNFYEFLSFFFCLFSNFFFNIKILGIILHRKYSSAFCLHVKQHHKSFGNMFLERKSL